MKQLAYAVGAVLLLAPVAQAQHGWLGGVRGGVVSGWAQDPAAPARSIVVRLYVDGPVGRGTYLGSATADRPRPDVVRATGVPGDHGFRFALPAASRVGRHQLYAYGLAIGGQDRLLGGAPIAYGVAAPRRVPGAAPAPTAGLRWVRDHPMFVSGLTVQMGRPPARAVARYFDAFHATAIHLWNDGLSGPLDGWLAHRSGAPWLAWLDPRGNATNQRLLGGRARIPPGRIGYQVGDEPRSLADLRRSVAGMRRVRRADPGALIVLNLTYLAPDLDQQLALVERTPECDVISYDDYSLGSRSVYERLGRFRAAGLRAHKPYWRYLYAYRGSSTPQESDMRWDAFLGLVYGYTGHTWFLYNARSTHGLTALLFDRTGDWSARATQHFALAARINQELSRLGRAVTQLVSTDVRYWPKYWYVPGGARRWRRGAGGDPYLAAIESSAADLAVGHFEDGNHERYVMLQNLNHTHGHFTVRSSRSSRVRVELDFSAATDPTLDRRHVQLLDARTGQVRDVPLTARGSHEVLEVTLAAGDPVLFKYKTARPFVRR